VSRATVAVIAVVSTFATAMVLAGAGSPQPTPPWVVAAVKRVVADRAVAARATAPQSARVAPPVSPPVSAAPAYSSLPSAPVTTQQSAAPAPAPPPAATEQSTAPAPAPATTQQSTTPAPAPNPTPKRTPSKAGHVFVILLTGAGYQATFGTQSQMPYLATQLRPQGALLSGFHPLDAADLPNYLALAGGLKPNAQTQANCPTYRDGECVQPNTVLSLGDQVTSSGRLWRSYAESMGDQPCRHPANGSADDTLQTRPGDEYATRHNPFVYFHSLLDLSDCQANDLDLSALPKDLRTTKTTPNLALIVPNLCNGGGEQPCADGTAGGPPAADAFLKTWVPQILASPAYRKDGALIVAFLTSDPGGLAPTGALVLSRFTRPATLYAKPFDPDALLRSLEDLFGLDALGQAKHAPSFAKLTFAKAFPPH
jgi:hypothetical protein